MAIPVFYYYYYYYYYVSANDHLTQKLLMSENLRISLGLRAYVCVCLRDRRGGAVSFIRPGPIFREACPNTVCSLPDLLRALAELRKAATVSFVMSVHAEQFGLPPNGLF